MHDQKDFRQNGDGRRFLKKAMIGLAAWIIALTPALAQQPTESSLTARDIDSAGLPPGIIRLSANENPLGPSPKALEAIKKYMDASNRYSWYEADEKGIPRRLDTGTVLIKALAKDNGIELPASFEERGSRRSPHPYVISSGSGLILSLLSIAYLSQGGGEVIEAELGYGDISGEAEDFNEAGIPTSVIRTPLTEDYKHDLDAMRRAITPKTSLVVITNPNNPTGTLLSYEELERFVNQVPKHVVVVIDEAYIHFVKDPNYRSAIPLAMANDNVVVVRTFSKVYGIKGIGLGYAVTSQAVKERLSMYNNGRASALAEMAGAAALEDHDHVQRVRQAVFDSKARMYEAFDEMGLEYIPSETNFVMVNVRRDAETVQNEMWKRRVSIQARYGDIMKGWIRISAGTMPETEVFLKTLRHVLTNVL